MTPELILDAALVSVALFLGGILKGATGAGAPILAVPVLVLLFDVRFAIVVMLIPNLVTNLAQAIRFVEHFPSLALVAPFLIGGMIGVATGTFMLAALSPQTLSMIVAISLVAYIALRLSKPEWHLAMPIAKKLSLHAGIAGGILQGSSGLSAPVSLTFLNAIRLPRQAFIATISSFFAVITVIQAPILFSSGLLSIQDVPFSAFAMLPILAGMPVGEKLAKTIAPEVFDKLILGLLGLIAARLLAGIFI